MSAAPKDAKDSKDAKDVKSTSSRMPVTNPDIRVYNVKGKLSPSLIPNNLSSSGSYLCYHSRNEQHSRNEVHIFKESLDDVLNEKQTAPLTTIIADRDVISQAKFCKISDLGTVLVITTQTGLVHIYDETGQKLIHFHKLQKSQVALSSREAHVSGIANTSTHFYFGSGSGEVLVFATSSKKFVLSRKLSGHKDPVTDLAVVEEGKDGAVLVSGDQQGNVVIWDIKDENSATKVYEHAGTGHPVTSVRVGGDYALVGYSSGHVRLFDLKTKRIFAEIAAHSRSVSAIDVHPTRSIFVTISEDTFLSIWTLPTAANSKKIRNIFCVNIGHNLYTGVQFCGRAASTVQQATPAVATAANNQAAAQAPQLSGLLCVSALDSKYLQFIHVPSGTP